MAKPRVHRAGQQARQGIATRRLKPRSPLRPSQRRVLSTRKAPIRRPSGRQSESFAMPRILRGLPGPVAPTIRARFACAVEVKASAAGAMKVGGLLLDPCRFARLIQMYTLYEKVRLLRVTALYCPISQVDMGGQVLTSPEYNTVNAALPATLADWVVREERTSTRAWQGAPIAPLRTRNDVLFKSFVDTGVSAANQTFMSDGRKCGWFIGTYGLGVVATTTIGWVEIHIEAELANAGTFAITPGTPHDIYTNPFTVGDLPESEVSERS